MKFKEIVVWLIVFVVGSLIVTFLVSPDSFNSFKSNIKSMFPSSSIQSQSSVNTPEDPLIKECVTAFNECLNIAMTKYTSLSVKILKYEKFNDNDSALEFFNTWANPMEKAMNPMNFQWNDVYTQTYGRVSYPVVLFSTQVSYDGIENPAVAICNSDGELQQNTKVGFMC